LPSYFVITLQLAGRNFQAFDGSLLEKAVWRGRPLC